MLQGYTMAIAPCGNPTPKKLPTSGGEWPTFRTARAQRTVHPPWMKGSTEQPQYPHCARTARAPRQGLPL